MNEILTTADSDLIREMADQPFARRRGDRLWALAARIDLAVEALSPEPIVDAEPICTHDGLMDQIGVISETDGSATIPTGQVGKGGNRCPSWSVGSFGATRCELPDGHTEDRHRWRDRATGVGLTWSTLVEDRRLTEAAKLANQAPQPQPQPCDATLRHLTCVLPLAHKGGHRDGWAGEWNHRQGMLPTEDGRTLDTRSPAQLREALRVAEAEVERLTKVDTEPRRPYFEAIAVGITLDTARTEFVPGELVR